MAQSNPTNEFLLWLETRRARIEEKLKQADATARVLLRTERAELDAVIAAYKRIVMQAHA
jgi:hypothetical protein